MPTYGYQCTQCDNAFEIVQKITDNPLQKCDDCGGELRKKIFPVGIQFKGSGFYINDYARSGSGAADKKSEGSAGEATAKEATTSSSDSTASAPTDSSSTAAAPTPAATSKPADPKPASSPA